MTGRWRRGRAPTVVAVLAVASLLGAACSSGSGDAADSSTTVPAAPLVATTPDLAPAPSAGCQGTAATPPGVSEGHVTSGGVDRVYQLDVPPSYDGTRPFALVLGLHSLTVDYRFVAMLNGFDEVKGKYDFIAVMPSGLVDGRTPYWYAAPTADNYDVTFISDLLDQLESTLCVDTARVFSTGMSNGAQMSALLACRLSDRIAGIAPVSGVEYPEPCDGKPVAVMAFHGSADPILPYTGGGLNATKIADLDYWKGKVPPGMPAAAGGGRVDAPVGGAQRLRPRPSGGPRLGLGPQADVVGLRRSHRALRRRRWRSLLAGPARARLRGDVRARHHRDRRHRPHVGLLLRPPAGLTRSRCDRFCRAIVMGCHLLRLRLIPAMSRITTGRRRNPSGRTLSVMTGRDRAIPTP